MRSQLTPAAILPSANRPPVAGSGKSIPRRTLLIGCPGIILWQPVGIWPFSRLFSAYG